ncbi:GxxExxY protein [Thiohalomonas denitrificans]|uniref:GxxExxY protein n=1 Tax=Thiohalomonas denitrificans TaxID=415747 RepID=UPI000B8882C1|nr:GxxExxY protein [Thiohalomonas denitrificans]
MATTLTRRIIGAVVEVHKTLGAGLLERIYEGSRLKTSVADEFRRAAAYQQYQKNISVRSVA